MHLKLKLTENEWNESCEYAKEVCKNLKTSRYEVRIKPYMYAGKEGIYLQVFDNMDNLLKYYATGIIYTNMDDMKKAIDTMALRIIKEC